VWYDFKWWVDSAETNARVAQAWTNAMESNPVGRQSLALSHALRGHLRDALEVAGTDTPALYAVLALLGGVSPDTARAQFAAWLDSGFGFGIFHGLRWWAADRDTLSLQRAIARYDSLSQTAQVPPPPVYDLLRASARGYLALARGDTTVALDQLAQVRPWPNQFSSYYQQLTRAQILSRRGEDAAAAGLLDSLAFATELGPSADAVIANLERGRVHERLGNRDLAVASYSYVLDAWRNADAVLQPIVAEARDALSRLAEEPRT
jgi:hypothetical protein